MKSWARRAALGSAIVGMAAGLLVVGAAVGSPRDNAPTPPTTATAPVDPLTASIAKLQSTLKEAPGNYRAWSDLGLAYVSQSRLTADPSFYTKAEGAFAKSIALRSADNADAITGQATLAAARHDFAEALTLINSSLRLNDFSATAYGVKADALTELGRYDQAAAAVQRMLNLQPGTPSFARASYQRELRGDVPGAREALERADEATRNPGDKAFAQFYLGELAWNTGDLTAARSAYDSALAQDPRYVQALVGQAKALALTDPTAALSLYREAVQTQPQPSYLIELGELLEATGQTTAAQEQYDVVRATQQLFAASGANVDLELALFEADHGSAATSLKYATAAFRARPDAILVQDAYAWALHKSGRSAQALPIARKAQRLGTRLPYLRYHLGVIEAAVGERAAARRSLSSALELNPSFNPLQAPAARKLLKSLG